MYRVKMLLINLLLCGAAGFFMRFVWVLISGEWEQLTWKAVIDNMVISGVIGTICMFSIFMITLFSKGSKAMVIAINMAVCLLLLGVVYVASGFTCNIWTLDLSWLVILIVSEATTYFLSVYFFRKITYYNQRLADKKKSLGLDAE